MQVPDEPPFEQHVTLQRFPHRGAPSHRVFVEPNGKGVVFQQVWREPPDLYSVLRVFAFRP